MIHYAMRGGFIDRIAYTDNCDDCGGSTTIMFECYTNYHNDMCPRCTARYLAERFDIGKERVAWV